MDLTLFGLRPNKSKTIWQKNLKKIKFYHVGLLNILINSQKSCKTYHFIVKSIFNNFSGWTRSHDAYARFSPIYNIVFSLYRVCLHLSSPSPPTRLNSFLARVWVGFYITAPPPPATIPCLPPKDAPHTTGTAVLYYTFSKIYLFAQDNYSQNSTVSETHS